LDHEGSFGEQYTVSRPTSSLYRRYLPRKHDLFIQKIKRAYGMIYRQLPCAEPRLFGPVLAHFIGFIEGNLNFIALEVEKRKYKFAGILDL
jgi:hypothetical protein